MNNWYWSFLVRYEWWAAVSFAAYGGRFAWAYYKSSTLPDQWIEDQKDLIGMYCAGGEL